MKSALDATDTAHQSADCSPSTKNAGRKPESVVASQSAGTERRRPTSAPTSDSAIATIVIIHTPRNLPIT